jgi:hypothetical protein
LDDFFLWLLQAKLQMTTPNSRKPSTTFNSLRPTPDLDRWRTWLKSRRTLFWSSEYLTTYNALEAAIRLTELKQQSNLSFAQPAPQMFEAYAKTLHKFDTVYRHFIVASDTAKPILREQ